MKTYVVLSGGQDSTIALYWAKLHHEVVGAITFDYGQRNRREIQAAVSVACEADLEDKLRILVLKAGECAVASDGTPVSDEVPFLTSTSPLVDENAELDTYESTEEMPDEDPSFVPMRNAVFLSIAANRAVAAGAEALVWGANSAFRGGYYDCRSRFVHYLQAAFSEGLTGQASGFTIHTPLQHLTKPQICMLGNQLPGCREALAYTHTCYDNSPEPCGRCHACVCRAEGYRDAGLTDPLIERLSDDSISSRANPESSDKP